MVWQIISLIDLHRKSQLKSGPSFVRRLFAFRHVRHVLVLFLRCRPPELRTTLNGTAPPRGSGGYHNHHVVPDER